MKVIIIISIVISWFFIACYFACFTLFSLFFSFSLKRMICWSKNWHIYYVADWHRTNRNMCMPYSFYTLVLPIYYLFIRAIYFTANLFILEFDTINKVLEKICMQCSALKLCFIMHRLNGMLDLIKKRLWCGTGTFTSFGLYDPKKLKWIFKWFQKISGIGFADKLNGFAANNFMAIPGCRYILSIHTIPISHDGKQ